MKVGSLFALVVSCLSSTVVAQSNSLSDPAAAFGARQSVSDIALSPDGGSIAYVAPGVGQETRLYVTDLSTGDTRLATGADGDPWEINWCEFDSNTRLVCTISALVETTGYIIPFSRRVAVNRDGSDPLALGQRQSAYQLGFSTSDGRIIDWLPDAADEVLMARVFIPEGRAATRMNRTEEGLGVVRVNIRTGEDDRVENPRDSVGNYMTDGHGNVRIMASQGRRGATGYADDTVRFYYRRSGENEWLDLDSYNTSTRGGFLPVAVDRDLNAAYGYSRHNGRMALYRVTLDAGLERELVYANDEVDVDGLVRIGPYDRVIGVSFADDYRQIEYFDPDYAALSQALSQALPNLPSLTIVDSTADEQILLILASSDTDPGRYYVFRRADNALNEIMVVRPELEGAALAEVRPVRYPAADGTMVPGYLTLPPGQDNPRGIPAIVMPHGGPSARDEWGFDWLSQYFANRGYAVLQRNYRGSEGYGDEWFVENGFQSWELAVGDITAGGRWLVSEGIADPAHLAIFGWSYGGYAALQSGVLDPGLFRAIVAVAPVTDLQLLKTQARLWYSGANTREFIGEGPHIRQGSPAQNAERIEVPVLMFHGDRDINVDIDQARRMQSRLESAGRETRLIEFDGLDHSLRESDARAEMLERSDYFLRTAMGLPMDGSTDRVRYQAEERAGSNAGSDSEEAERPVFPGAAVPEDSVGPGAVTDE